MCNKLLKKQIDYVVNAIPFHSGSIQPATLVKIVIRIIHLIICNCDVFVNEPSCFALLILGTIMLI